MAKLTETQKKIIDDLKAEFLFINDRRKTIDKSIINVLYNEAKKYADAHRNFYENIERNNQIITNQRDELLEAFYNKLVILFDGTDVLVNRKDSYIQVGYPRSSTVSDTLRFQNGNFIIRGNVTIKGYPMFDDKCDKTTEYKATNISLDNVALDLDNFETSNIFKERVNEMFTTFLTK